MCEVLTLEPSEVLHQNWHVMGSRKIDFLIRLFNTITDRQLTIITDESSWAARLESKCPKHIVKYSHSFDTDIPCIYIKRAQSADHASTMHKWVKNHFTLYTVCDYNVRANLSDQCKLALNTLHITDSELKAITRYNKEGYNERIAFSA